MITELCTYCDSPATTRDHIPPKAIFPKPRPSNLITVPACVRCNGNWSALDEIFKLFVSLQAGMEGISEKTLHDSVKRTVAHNKKLNRFLREKAKKVEIRTPGGIILGDACGLPFPSKELKLMCERVIKGLFYHHKKYKIPNDSELSVYLPSDINEGVLELVKDSQLKIIGNDREFIYCYGAANDHAFASTWVLLFYKRFLAVGFVIPKDKKANKTIVQDRK